MNNNPQNDKKVSVRADSGGHSFSFDTLPESLFDGTAQVEFSVSTHKTTLLPAVVFDERSAAKYLAVAGLACREDERALCITCGNIVAVVAVSVEFLARVAETFGARASFTSPLLELCREEGSKMHIRRAGDVSYVVFCVNGKLRFAEAFRTESEEEVLYYVHLLRDRFDLNEYLIYISGEHSEATARLLSKYFSHVKCE